VSTNKLQSDVVIVGGGIAGIVCALELLDSNLKIILVDRDEEKNFGGLAKESFGGMFFVDTPHQRRFGIRDNTDLALSDWYSFAEFEESEIWQKKWAEQYVNLCRDEVYYWLKEKSISFFPVVHWVERGYLKPGNSVPRFHMVWGTGHGLATTLIGKLQNHQNKENLTCLFQHKVNDLIFSGDVAVGVAGLDEASGTDFEITAGNVVVAAGGIGGNIEKVKSNWYKPWGEPPETIINGSHKYALGELHDLVKTHGGEVTNLDKMWNYAAGVPHHKPNKPNHGLSLVPPKSALWLDYKGRRLGPMPLISGYDTRYLVEKVCEQEKKYSWQVLNAKIAYKEFAISGSEHNAAIRDKSWLGFIKIILFGNKRLVNEFLAENSSFVIGYSLDELAEKMNKITGEGDLDINFLKESVNNYDQNIERGPKYFNDEQLRRIAHLRQYRGDRLRTCKFQKINDSKAMPLIAIREFILSRKSLGGIQTDLNSRVLSNKGIEIPGLYAVGESAGFGGGGMHGIRSLEGTFLGGCVLTARMAARCILQKN